MTSEGDSFGSLAVALELDKDLLGNARQLFLDVSSSGRGSALIRIDRHWSLLEGSTASG